MSYTYRYDLINTLIQKFGFKNYLEIGVSDPSECFNNVICENKISIQNTLNLYSRFASISGIDLNVDKTEILIAGGSPAERMDPVNIIYQNRKLSLAPQAEVKICGVTFSHDKEISHMQNVTNNINKLQNVLNHWRMRNLSLIGKSIIVKSYGISQLIFFMQQTVFYQKDLDTIDEIINKFMWNKKQNSRQTGLLSKKLIKSDTEHGGLNAVDVHNMDMAFKYKHLLRNTGERNNHPLVNDTGTDFRQFFLRKLFVRNFFDDMTVCATFFPST